MFSKCAFVFIGSRIGLNGQRNVKSAIQKCYFASAAPPKFLPTVDRRDKDKKFVEKQENDADVFGTLSPQFRQFDALDSLGSDKLMEEGDQEEEKYISFDPAERKQIRECEEEIDRLIEGRKLKEAFHFLEVTMKEDKVKPSRGIYSMLIAACGKAGYTHKAFKLYNDVIKIAFIHLYMPYLLLTVAFELIADEEKRFLSYRQPNYLTL